MPKEPQKKEPAENIVENDSWAEDQEKHEYYYDDAHGYEVYVPEDKMEDEPRAGAEY